MRGLVRAAAVAAVAASLGGCATLGYYAQSVAGHLDVMLGARPIGDVIADPATTPARRARLERVREIREFASRELALPDNGSYREFSATGRRYVVWTVVAAPALSLVPRRWCFLVVGCVSYRGYYHEADARAFAATLRAQGLDVYVGGVRAYSTLGWFDDPVLDTMLAEPESYLAGTLFHELAHQRLYVAGDTEFDESFAVTVQRVGVARWLAHAGTPAQRARHADDVRKRAAFVALVRGARADLAALYASHASDAEKRAGKARRFARLRSDYARLRARWGGDPRYDRWFADDLDNAKLALFTEYDGWVPAFERLLAREGGDLRRFYAACEALAAKPRAVRDAALARLARG